MHQTAIGWGRTQVRELAGFDDFAAEIKRLLQLGEVHGTRVQVLGTNRKLGHGIVLQAAKLAGVFYLLHRLVPRFPRLPLGFVDLFCGFVLDYSFLPGVVLGADQLDRPAGARGDHSLKGNVLPAGKIDFGKLHLDVARRREIAIQDSENALFAGDSIDPGDAALHIGARGNNQVVEGIYRLEHMAVDLLSGFLDPDVFFQRDLEWRAFR